MKASEISVDLGRIALGGSLALPEGAWGLVLFAHGSGSSRFSPRNRFVASALNHAGLATLLFDLLTEDEERIDQQTAALRFDVELLGYRLMALADWVAGVPELRALPLGSFGSSTGAAAALIAAARQPDRVRAIVSRGGRPDLAGDELEFVRAPTLLAVGGDDGPVIDLNRAALRRLHCEAELRIIPGATHLFAEPGALEAVAALAADWFSHHLAPHEVRAPRPPAE